MKKLICTLFLVVGMGAPTIAMGAEVALVLFSIEHPEIATLLLTTFSPTLVPLSITAQAQAATIANPNHHEEMLIAKDDAIAFLESGKASDSFGEILKTVRENFPETENSTDPEIAIKLLTTIENQSVQ